MNDFFINDMPVTVYYDYDPGQVEYVSGKPEDCYPSYPPEAEVLQVLTKDFYDIFDYLSEAQLEKLEDEILEFEKNGGGE